MSDPGPGSSSSPSGGNPTDGYANLPTRTHRLPKIVWPPTYKGQRRFGVFRSEVLTRRYPPGEFDITTDVITKTFTLRTGSDSRPDGARLPLDPHRAPYHQRAVPKSGLRLHRVTFRYDPSHILGEGGYGTVFLGDGLFQPLPPDMGQQPVVGKLVVKEMAIRDDGFEKRNYDGNPPEFFHYPLDFLALSALRHPNIVTLFDYTLEEGVAWYAFMALVHGGDSDGYIQEWAAYQKELNRETPLPDQLVRDGLRPKWGALPEVVLRSLALHLLAALQFCHYHGICHMDLKPENLLISKHGVFILADFGISAPVAKTSTSPENKRIILGGGTPPYMAPEVMAFCEECHPTWPPEPFDGTKSDMFSVGIVLFEGRYNTRPFPERYNEEEGRDDLTRLHEDRKHFKGWLTTFIPHADLTARSSRDFPALLQSLMNPSWEARPTAEYLLKWDAWLRPKSDAIHRFVTSWGDLEVETQF